MNNIYLGVHLAPLGKSRVTSVSIKLFIWLYLMMPDGFIAKYRIYS